MFPDQLVSVANHFDGGNKRTTREYSHELLKLYLVPFQSAISKCQNGSLKFEFDTLKLSMDS